MHIKPYTRKAQYYETDQMGVIHHSNYIRWMEEARVDFMEQVGYGYRKVEALGYGIPIISVSCEYKSPVHFGDTITIYSHIVSCSAVRMTVAYKMMDASTGKLRTTGQTKHCFLNTEGRPISIKRELPEFYELLSEFIQPTLDMS